MHLILTALLAMALPSSNLHLRSLKDASVLKLQTSANKPRVFIVFQEKCSACRKQIKDLSCLKNAAEVILVGAFSTEKALRKEYQNFRTDLVGVYADEDFKKYINLELELSPQTFLQVHRETYKMIGVKRCSKILKFLNTKI
jgi:hypothetical protein